METWAARTWTIDTLINKFGQVTVPVEISRWNSMEKRWSDYRDLYAGGRGRENWVELFLPHQPMELQDFIDTFMKRVEEQAAEPLLQGYLAQQQLLDELPSMAEGILDPDYTKVGKGVYQRNVWLGPAGTVTPMHRDPYHNILAQVWGSKYIRLYNPLQGANLYPFTNILHLRNTSQVDVEASNAAEKWPEFMKAPYFECELHAGEMIYFPVKWYKNDPLF